MSFAEITCQGTLENVTRLDPKKPNEYTAELPLMLQDGSEVIAKVTGYDEVPLIEGAVYELIGLLSYVGARHGVEIRVEVLYRYNGQPSDGETYFTAIADFVDGKEDASISLCGRVISIDANGRIVTVSGSVFICGALKGWTIRVHVPNNKRFANLFMPRVGSIIAVRGTLMSFGPDAVNVELQRMTFVSSRGTDAGGPAPPGAVAAAKPSTPFNRFRRGGASAAAKRKVDALESSVQDSIQSIQFTADVDAASISNSTLPSTPPFPITAPTSAVVPPAKKARIARAPTKKAAAAAAATAAATAAAAAAAVDAMEYTFPDGNGTGEDVVE